MSSESSRIDARVGADLKRALKAKLALDGRTVTEWVKERVRQEVGDVAALPVVEPTGATKEGASDDIGP